MVKGVLRLGSGFGSGGPARLRTSAASDAERDNRRHRADGRTGERGDRRHRVADGDQYGDDEREQYARHRESLSEAGCRVGFVPSHRI